MSRVTDTCSRCARSRTLPRSQVDSAAEVAARAAHAARAHPGTSVVFRREERWGWLRPLAAINIGALVVSAVAAAGVWADVTSGWTMLAFFFPVVAGTIAVPGIGGVVAFLVIVVAVVFALAGPRGAPRGPRLVAGITLSGFAVTVSCPVVAAAFFLLAPSSFPG